MLGGVRLRIEGEVGEVVEEDVVVGGVIKEGRARAVVVEEVMRIRERVYIRRCRRREGE